MLRIAALAGLALTILLGDARAGDAAGANPEQNPKYAVATFAGGCFWCMQPPFDHTKGVIKTIAGYTGGATVNPTYEQVSEGGTGHAESVDVIFDPAAVSYKELLQIYWHNVDPLVKDQQFCDAGHQYRTAIFYHGDEQKQLAENSKKEVEAKLKVAVQTEIVAASAFYPAEDYHQEYYKKNPVRYKFYRWNCGRDQRLKQLWGANAGHIEE